ncbi:DUF3515 family protein [Demequina sp.]|uniref:DUF3515 family protein n=1 Tax=Demequina sp. TaxID=2050685 RepID=UPI003D0C82AE
MRFLGLAAVCGASAAVLAGCSQPLVVDPAPYAADPDCARVMLAMPSELGGLDVRGTTSQATAAYGDEYPIVVRCGVEPPGPTTESCVEVAAEAGTQDWLVVEDGDQWRATSFGRSPAVEVLIPTARAQDAVADLLAEVSGPAALAPSNGLECK